MKRIGHPSKIQHTISIIMIMTIMSCCHMPLVDCFYFPLSVDTPKVVVDSTISEDQYSINADLLERKKKKEYTLLIAVSHDKNKIRSSEKRNFYLLNGEKIYSDKVVSFDPVNEISENEINIWFFLPRESLETMIEEKSSFITEVTTYNGSDTLNIEMPYQLEFSIKL